MRTNPMEVVDHQQYLFSEVTSLTNSINMNSLIVFCVLSLAALTIAHPDGATYTDKYDNVDLDEILGNRRLMVPYIKCMLDQGKCAPDAKELKEWNSEISLQNTSRKLSRTSAANVPRPRRREPAASSVT
ncbi:uncharacterized protein LOC124638421 isoform X2 [Helicoverpa zea]|uniref:uncharacterized protein LOC124638421 isoform X2 n=1 Tax=Helicoverpa zea TaxID=7113 RepID=UPI001F5ACF7A|nr:uncharacterized protein LOC124638421 isoform X2 [Helicoverpa zea]